MKIAFKEKNNLVIEFGNGVLKHFFRPRANCRWRFIATVSNPIITTIIKHKKAPIPHAHTGGKEGSGQSKRDYRTQYARVGAPSQAESKKVIRFLPDCARIKLGL